MYITPISQQNIKYTVPLKTSKHGYLSNNNSCNTVSFKKLNHRIDTICATIGCISGAIALLLLGTMRCDRQKENDNRYAERDSLYYHQVDSAHLDNIFVGLNDSVTPKQAEQRDNLIAGKDSMLIDFPYETPARDSLENIFLNRIDSVTLPATRGGKEITKLEETQVFMDLGDSIKAKYPDKKINVKL